jgi:DNA polymerase-3 subunit epsilon
MLLRHSVLFEALFPTPSESNNGTDENILALRRRVRHTVLPQSLLLDVPLVVFDTETTGLDSQLDRIIEIGAIKYVNGKAVDEFLSFVSTDTELSPTIINLTGITQSMLKGAPTIDEVLPKFLNFIRGGIIVAHNAEFDMGMLHAACGRMGYDLEWPCFCTLKLARRILPGLPRYNLDTLAEHFKLTFESRHRAVGDVKVLAGVLHSILDDDEYGIATFADVLDSVVA